MGKFVCEFMRDYPANVLHENLHILSNLFNMYLILKTKWKNI